MNSFELILFTRTGCCLCEGLEEKLKRICFKELHPEIHFLIKNIDGEEVPQMEKTRYSMQVPVLIFSLKTEDRVIELPRVSPRLTQQGLFDWLQKMIQEKIVRQSKV